MPQAFAQLSDPHLSTLDDVAVASLLGKRLLGYLSWRRKRRFEHRAEVLAALREDLATEILDQTLVTGDLTHIGLPAEFEQARRWLEQLGAPQQVAVVPGNHDACVEAPWTDTFAHWTAYMASDSGNIPNTETAPFPSLRVRGDIAFIGLSSACPTPPLMATGRVGRDQLEQLPELLDRAAAQGLFRVVYLHHCPLPGQEKWRKRLTDAAALSAVLQHHGVELVLHGHGHRAHRHTLTTCAGEAQVIAVPSASALGLHGSDIAHYNCYRVEPVSGGWALRTEYRRYEVGSGRFVAAGEDHVVVARDHAAEQSA